MLIPGYDINLDESFVKKIKQHYVNNIVYPPYEQIFSAFLMTPLQEVKVVLIGQDPYHTPGAAMGLAFSVNKDAKIPPSLRNIYLELMKDYQVMRSNGDLSGWAKQGVLLMNRSLTVIKNKAHSDAKFGWDQYTDAVIAKINAQCQHVVFVLLGNFATRYKEMIDDKNHLVITLSHPSPLAYYRSFKDSKLFIQINEYLQLHQKETIDWSM